MINILFVKSMEADLSWLYFDFEILAHSTYL